jgi:L-asparagine permease
VFGSLLNFLVPDAFEIALEAAAIGVIFTWGTIFASQLRLRKLTDAGVIPPSPFRMPGSPYTSYIGLAFLAMVLVGMAISGWQSSPYLSHKINFLVIVFGIPILAVVLAIGWRAVRPAVVANTGDRLESVWADDGPRYGGVTPDDLDVSEQDPEDHRLTEREFDASHDHHHRHDRHDRRD